MLPLLLFLPFMITQKKSARCLLRSLIVSFGTFITERMCMGMLERTCLIRVNFSPLERRVADFGLSKEVVFDGRNSGLKGTYGYIDPVYMSTNKFTMKSDIFSFGIIIFELITAIHPQQNLMEYINLAAMSPTGVDEILDKELVGECSLEEVRGLASIAHKCLHKLPRKRPSIGEVSQAILKSKQRHLAKVDTMSFAGRDISRAVSRIENQQLELTKMASLKETE